MNIFMTITGGIIGYFLIALFNTFQKEKSMIEEGGDPLPTSAYLFLGIKHGLWAVIAWFGFYVIPLHWFSASNLVVILLGAGYIILTYLVATLIEVVIRTVIIYFRVRQLSKREQEDEGA